MAAREIGAGEAGAREKWGAVVGGVCEGRCRGVGAAEPFREQAKSRIMAAPNDLDTPEGRKAEIERLDPDLHGLLERKQVAERTQAKLAQSGVLALSRFGSLADTKAEVRDFCEGALGLSKVRDAVEVAGVVDAWAAAQTRMEARHKAEAEADLAGLPNAKVLNKAELQDLRARFEATYYVLEEKVQSREDTESQQLRVLYAFAGDERKASIGEYLRAMQWPAGFEVHIEEIDIIRDPDHDLSDTDRQAAWLTQIKEGYWHVVLVTPPCSTWSMANLLGPPPLRDRRYIWGYPWLAQRWPRDLILGNILVEFMLSVLEEVERRPEAHDGRPVAFFVEHPEDLGATIRAEDQRKFYLASIWQLEALRQRIDQGIPGAFTVTINQCCHGADYPKPTRLATNLQQLRSWGLPSGRLWTRTVSSKSRRTRAAAPFTPRSHAQRTGSAPQAPQPTPRSWQRASPRPSTTTSSTTSLNWGQMEGWTRKWGSRTRKWGRKARSRGRGKGAEKRREEGRAGKSSCGEWRGESSKRSQAGSSRRRDTSSWRTTRGHTGRSTTGEDYRRGGGRGWTAQKTWSSTSTCRWQQRSRCSS